MRVIYIALLLWMTPIHALHAEPPIRFGLTAVVLTENLRFLDQWSDYLEEKMGREVEFVLRKSYREVMDLLSSGGIEFAWICGYPYVQASSSNLIELMTVPIYHGKPLYHSYIIVHNSSPYKELSDLENRIFAFSDPDSNSGFLYPMSLLAKKNKKPESFFRHTFFTFNHAETVQAVSEQVADGGAVDSYIWEYLAIFKPEITEQTRIINKSPMFGFPPIVARSDVDAETVSLMKQTLENMDEDPAGSVFLSRLKLDSFSHFPDSLFNDIRSMANSIQITSTNKYATQSTD